MAQECKVEGCGKTTYKLSFQGGVWRGHDCGCAKAWYKQRSTVNAFDDLTLQHVHDEFGKPIHCENMQQLERAQTRYGFEHVTLNYDGSNQNDPPQQRKIDMNTLYKRKFQRA